MNVTFHTVAAIAVAAALSSKQTKTSSSKLFTLADMPVLVIGFAVVVISHGLLDYLPHSYPIKSVADVVLSLVFFASGIIFVKRMNRLLFAVCFLGSIFPDLIDLGPAILNKRLGWHLPVFKIFPWHWPQYSGSIYDGSRSVESLLAHIFIIGSSLFVLYMRRETFWNFAEDMRAGKAPL